MPLSYRGVELTAGINNHAGMIYGDPKGKIDNLFSAQLLQDDGEEVEGTWGNFLIEVANYASGEGTYIDEEQSKELEELRNSK